MAVLTVRAAGLGDLGAVAGLAAARRREALPAVPWAGAEARAWGEALACTYGRPGSLLLVLDADGTPVGYAAASMVDGLAGVPEGGISDVYVAPELRRRGGAAALVRACEGALRAWGLRSVTALVPADGPAAQMLAASLGYAAERVVLARPVTTS